MIALVESTFLIVAELFIFIAEVLQIWFKWIFDRPQQMHDPKTRCTYWTVLKPRVCEIHVNQGVGLDETPHRYAWEECEDVLSFIDFADNDVQGFD